MSVKSSRMKQVHSVDQLHIKVEEGELLNLKTIFPTLDDIKKMNIHIEDYLSQNSGKTAVYGGTAIEALLGTKGQTEKVIDYDFYTPEYTKVSVEVANLLFDKGYKYVRRINAINPDTFRVGAEFAKEFIADITFMPSKAFKGIPKIKIDGIDYISPQFLKIDLYKSITRPNTNVYRWKKSYTRLEAIEEKFPLPKPKKTPAFPKGMSSKLMKKIKDHIAKRHLIPTGTEAYNYYTSVARQSVAMPVEVLEYYATGANSEARKLVRTLGKGYTITKYYPFLNIIPRKSVVFHKEIPIVIFYEIGFDCIGKGIDNYINFHCLLCFLYAKYNIAVINKDTNAQAVYSLQINNLQEASRDYNKKNKLTGFEATNPFRIFQTDCLTADTGGMVIAAAKRLFYGLPQPKGYKPEKEYINPKDIKEKYHNNYLSEQITTEDTLHSLEPEILDTVSDEILRTIAMKED